MTTQPSFEDVASLATLHTATVEPSYIDVNGHMNIRHYLEHAAHGAELTVRDIGVHDEYRATRGLGIFTAEHHLRYLSEMHEGSTLTVHTRVLDRSAKAAHLMSFVVDRTERRLATTLEIVVVHVDLGARRATPMPEDIAAGFERWIARSRALGWPAPTCGAMGVRRPS